MAPVSRQFPLTCAIQKLGAELEDSCKEEGGTAAGTRRGGKKRKLYSAQKRYRARQKRKMKELHSIQVQLSGKVRDVRAVKRTCACLQVWPRSTERCFRVLDG